MREYNARSDHVSTIASLVAIFMAICVSFLGIYLDLSSDSSFLIGLFIAILTFIPARYLIDKLYPHNSIAATYDDPEQGSGIIDKNDEEVFVSESAGEESQLPDEKPMMDARFLEAVELIEKEFHPQIVRDEEELESRLFALLSGRYPDHIQKNVAAPDGNIDIVLDDIYGIEAKAVRDEEILRNLIGDVAFYADRYKHTAVILFIDRLLAPKIDLERYTEKLDHYGTIVIIKQGMIEGRR